MRLALTGAGELTVCTAPLREAASGGKAAGSAVAPPTMNFSLKDGRQMIFSCSTAIIIIRDTFC